MADSEIDSDFTADERIFHYTSSTACFAILQSNCLWATDFRFLNDRQELRAARASLVEFVAYDLKRKIASLKIMQKITLKDRTDLKELAQHEAETIIDTMYTVAFDMAWRFIFSGFVCDSKDPQYRNGGLLHWATYGRGGGCAIRLNPHKLKRLFDMESARLVCGYRSSRAYYTDPHSKPPIALQSAYDAIGVVAQQMLEDLTTKGQIQETTLDGSALPFDLLMSVLKDPYFAGENEARIIVSVPRFERTRSRHKILVRHKEQTVIPYVKMFEDMLLGEQNPIEAIIIGPHPRRATMKDALAMVLESKGLDQIEVMESDVPYVGD